VHKFKRQTYRPYGRPRCRPLVTRLSRRTRPARDSGSQAPNDHWTRRGFQSAALSDLTCRLADVSVEVLPIQEAVSSASCSRPASPGRRPRRRRRQSRCRPARDQLSRHHWSPATSGLGTKRSAIHRDSARQCSRVPRPVARHCPASVVCPCFPPLFVNKRYARINRFRGEAGSFVRAR